MGIMLSASTPVRSGSRCSVGSINTMFLSRVAVLPVCVCVCVCVCMQYNTKHTPCTLAHTVTRLHAPLRYREICTCPESMLRVSFSSSHTTLPV